MNHTSDIDSDPAWRNHLRNALDHFARGMTSSVELLAPGNLAPPSGEDRRRKVLLPGSFNPLHRGHIAMARWAHLQLGLPVWFEFSFVNADKPATYLDEICQRLPWTLVRQPSESHAELGMTLRPHGLLLSGNARFLNKARDFPGCIFAVGTDTLERIADPGFYGGQTEARDQAIDEMAALGCRFMVFGRLRGGRFQALLDLELPTALGDICDPVPEDGFRFDISSTEIREGPSSQASSLSNVPGK